MQAKNKTSLSSIGTADRDGKLTNEHVDVVRFLFLYYPLMNVIDDLSTIND